MEQIKIPQQNTKPKKTYSVEIEGSPYTVKASVLIARQATRYFNNLQRTTKSLESNFTTDLLEDIYDNAIGMYELLLGEKQANKLLKQIDDRYDVETAQTVLVQYAMSLYFISSGASQEVINNIFFSGEPTEEKQ